MYPLKFKRELKEKVWGGRNLQTLLDINLPENILVGESWEVSTHNNGISVVNNGIHRDIKLTNLLENFGPEILGQEIISRFGKKLPILVKFLDINDKLSIQVHPDNKYALLKEGDLGKEESWYVISASDDAEIIMGLNQGITENEFKIAVKNSNFDSVFRKVKVKAGDFINIKPGTVHGTFKGSILICEVQQNSDVTYRVYDYDRNFNGKKRELHIEKSLEVINYNAKLDLSTNEDRIKYRVGNSFKEDLVSCEFYNMSKYLVFDNYSFGVTSSFRIITILGGNGMIKNADEDIDINKGETLLIPANYDLNITGESLEIIIISV